jgi:hypothetical protein
VPVILTQPGFSGQVYNNHVSSAKMLIATIIAGCGIHMTDTPVQRHDGIHETLSQKRRKIEIH